MNRPPASSLRRRSFLRSSAGAAAFVSVTGSAGAEPQPSWTRRVTRAKPVHPLFEPLELRYALSWNGVIEAGEMTITVGKPVPGRRDLLMGESRGASRGLAGRLWPYSHHFRSVFDPRGLVPREFHAEEKERNEITTTTVLFSPREVRSTKVVRTQRTGEREVKEKTFAFSPAYDLLSGILYIRSLPLKPGEESVVVMHPFTTPYLTVCKALRRETIDTALGRKPAIKCEIKIGKIRRNLRLKSYSKMKRGLIWISDDADRLPVEIRSEIFVGSVRASLVGRRAI